MRKIKTSDIKVMRERGRISAMRELRMTRGQVEAAMRRYGVKSPVPAGGQRKLSAEDIAQVMMLRSSGFTFDQIGLMKGCTGRGIAKALAAAEKHGFGKYPKRAR